MICNGNKISVLKKDGNSLQKLLTRNIVLFFLASSNCKSTLTLPVSLILNRRLNETVMKDYCTIGYVLVEVGGKNKFKRNLQSGS